MNRRNPLLGLLIFSFHSASVSLALVLLLSLIKGIVAIGLLEHFFIMSSFHYLAAGAAPYVMLMKSEGTAKWEQYQLAMPVKRKNLATILYLNVLAASLLVIPIIGVVWGVGFLFNQAAMHEIIQTGLINITFSLSFILLMTALLYPLASTKLGQFSEQGLFFIGMVFSGAILGALAGIGNALGYSWGVISLFVIIISVIAFIVSLCITRKQYAKIDF